MTKSSRKPSPLLSYDPKGEALLAKIWNQLDLPADVGAIWVKQGDTPAGYFVSHDPPNVVRLLFILEGLPIHPENLIVWRDWMRDEKFRDTRTLLLEEVGGPEGHEEKISGALRTWIRPKPRQEACRIEMGSMVQLDSKHLKADPSLLTLTVGNMGLLLNQLDRLRKRFTIRIKDFLAHAEDYKRLITKVIQDPSAAEKSDIKERIKSMTQAHGERFPIVLLLGATGVGKTLFARYLAEDGAPARISIPEYLEHEHMFEYDFFGYAKGAYTGGDPEGNAGILIQNMGSVVFIDEIGESTPTIQTKLLAYLDDFRFRPRGWTGPAIYCPTFIVAATNQAVLEPSNPPGLYRQDLIQRFTDTLQLPALRDRIEELPFILDCLLQNAEINPDLAIREIGEGAYKGLSIRDYSRGNFRELESVLRAACQRAFVDGRAYLVAGDIK